ncbi:MAG: hypothetical protein R3B49_03335 [Phycisphaerales bacterium]
MEKQVGRVEIGRGDGEADDDDVERAVGRDGGDALGDPDVGDDGVDGADGDERGGDAGVGVDLADELIGDAGPAPDAEEFAVGRGYSMACGVLAVGSRRRAWRCRR